MPTPSSQQLPTALDISLWNTPKGLPHTHQAVLPNPELDALQAACCGGCCFPQPGTPSCCSGSRSDFALPSTFLSLHFWCKVVTISTTGQRRERRERGFGCTQDALSAGRFSLSLASLEVTTPRTLPCGLQDAFGAWLPASSHPVHSISDIRFYRRPST